MTTRAAIYTRISRDREGAGLGVERQEQDCRELTATHGWEVVRVYADNDLSAYSGKPRPGYRQMLDDIRSQQFGAVVAWHTDRLHRSPSELEEYITACDEAGVVTATVKAGHLDLSSAVGQLVARTLGGIARYEVDHMIERAQRAKLQAASDGRWRGGRRPYGYEADGMTVVPSEAQEVAHMAEMILLGGSLRSLAADLNARGVLTSTGTPWRQEAVRKVLLRPRNAGLIDYKGSILGPAQWQPLLKEETWRAVVAILTNPARTTHTSTGRRWLGSGIYRCGLCGSPVKAHTTISVVRPGSVTKPQYVCTRKKEIARNCADVDDLVGSVVIERCSRPDALELLVERPGTDMTALHAHAAGLRERRDELTSLFTDGAIDAVQLRDGTARLREQLALIEAKIAEASRGSVLAGLAGAPDPAAVWEGMALDRRRAVVSALMQVRILPAPKGKPPAWQPGESYFRPETVEITPRV